jgi:hypothetical protein
MYGQGKARACEVASHDSLPCKPSITGHLVFVLVSTELATMCPVTDNPASCEIHAVICFHHAKNKSAAKIHRELCAAVYGQNVTSEGTLGQWSRMFKDGRTNVHDEEQSGRPSVVSDDLVQSERWRFIISEIFCVFPQISCTVLYEIITVRLGYHKFCTDGFRICSQACAKCREWLQLWLL